MDKGRASALVVIDKHRKRKNLLRRSYLKKVKCARQNYKPEDVLAAMHAIWRGMSRRQASKKFNIPRSTLLDKLDGKRPVDASPGPNPFLTKAEECTLESWAIDLYRRGFPLKTEDLKDMAQAVIKSNQRRTSFKNGRPGRSWMRNFLIRHPKVYEISSDMAPGPRRTRTVTTREEVRQWCQQHRQFLASIGQEGILDSPNRVFNVDHGQFFFDSTSGQFLDQERYDRIEERDRERSEQFDRFSTGVECISIVATFTAAGGMAPLMFVHPYKDSVQEIAETFPSNWIGTHSESGLVTGKIFLDYIIAFRKWLLEENVTLPVLLLVDGRRSRLNIDITRYCEEQGIILYCLFPTPRPAISELFSSSLHDSLNVITKSNFASSLQEALRKWKDSTHSESTLPVWSVLPHLQSMLQTLREVRAEPLENLPPLDYSLLHNQVNFMDKLPDTEEYESDCEFDIELTPVEGEIEIEFPWVENFDPQELAHHPALLTDSSIPKYLVFKMSPVPLEPASSPTPTNSCQTSSQMSNPSVDNDFCVEDRVDQPDLQAHLIVKPLSSPLPETDSGIAKVESEINDVLDTILSMGSAHQVKSEPQQPGVDPPEEPFLGFSPEDAPIQQSTVDARGFLRFMEYALEGKGLLVDFKLASIERQWNGAPEAKLLFETWLAANDECCK